MPDTLAPYACDKCRTRKIGCSRTRSGCQRCKNERIACTYSRSGVIRRTRKRKREILTGGQASPPSTSSRNPGVDGGSLQSQLATDIEVTRERLHGLDTSQHNSLGALSSLSEAYAAVWHDASEFVQTGKQFFLFEDRAVSWVNVFVATLGRGQPLFDPAPPEVLDHLRASRPHQVHDRAWLVMYYSVILSMVSSNDPMDESTKAKLRCNLWLALNDVRILLEPSETNIQALVLLACHVEEFTTPSLSWMLITNACRMLQALGINHRRFDSRTRERRAMMFWHLNVLDTAMALNFGRPPTFHRAMSREIALPALDQLLSFEPHRTATSAPALFGAHFIHQVFQSSRIVAAVWHCLYEEAAADDRSIGLVREELDLWHRQARELLEAAALVERPFLDPRGAASIDLGLRSMTFQYHYLLVLLARLSTRMRTQCVDSSKRMLHLLEDMVSDSEEPYNGIIWLLLCTPFTPFLVLFGEILSNGKVGSRENEDALTAMEQLPIFLSKMRLRNSLAKKLERVSVVLMQHARAVMHPQESRASDAAPCSGVATGVLPDAWPLTGNMLDWDSFFNHAMTAPILDQPHVDNHDVQQSELATWMNDLFGDALVDWIGTEV